MKRIYTLLSHLAKHLLRSEVVGRKRVEQMFKANFKPKPKKLNDDMRDARLIYEKKKQTMS